MILRKLSLCAALIFLTACAGLKPTLSELEKSDIIERAHRAAPSACAYAGRVRLRYLDEAGQIRASSVVLKTCSGDMEIKVLGLFGAVAAEIGVNDGEYLVMSKGEDVTGEFAMTVTPADVEVIQRAMSLPPELPDMSFDARRHNGGYVFTKGEHTIYLDGSYMVGSVEHPHYSVAYRWDGKAPFSITISRSDMVLELIFSDKWKLD